MPDIELPEYIDPLEIELEDRTAEGVQQYPEDEWFNDYGVEEPTLIQMQAPDITDQELYWALGEMEELEVEDTVMLDKAAALESAEVPYAWQYWLHGETEFPDDAPSAPPQSGDVDDDGNIVP